MSKAATPLFARPPHWYIEAMAYRTLLITLALLLIALPCHADPAAELDVENVPTPLTLPELLPPGGIEDVKVEFWMRIEASYKDRPMDVRFIHWHVKPINGQLVFTMDSGTAGSKLHSSAKTIYSKEGELIAYTNISHLKGKKTSEVIGTIAEGQLILTTTKYDANGKASTSNQTKSLEPFESSVPSEWFSLVAAYHFRKGSLSYGFARTDTAYNFQPAFTIIEDVGTEQVEWDGQTLNARMLLGDRTFGRTRHDEVDSKFQYLVLPNGELMYMRNLYHGYKFLGYRVTKEAIEKEFWLPPAEVAKPEQPAE